MADSVGGVGGVGGAGGVPNLFGNLMLDMLEQTLSSGGKPPSGETKNALDTLRNALSGNQQQAAKQVGQGEGSQGPGGAEGANGAEGGKGKQDVMGLLQMLMQLMLLMMQMMQMMQQGEQGGQGGQSPGGFSPTPQASNTAGQLPGGSPLSQLGDGLIGLGDGLMNFAQAIPA